MGQVKNFALWLSESIYSRHMSNEAILSALAARYPDGDLDRSREWLLEQIRIVKTNPQLYSGHGTAKRPPRAGGMT